MTLAAPDALLPRVLVFSEGALSASHGTGTIFARNFGAYPRERLANWFIGGSEDPLFPDALNLNPARWPRSAVWPPTTLIAKFWNRCGLRPRWSMPVNVAALRASAQAQPFVPDLVYAIVISRAGVDALEALLQGLPARVRVVLQIQDFFPSAGLGIRPALRRLAPRVAEVWAVSRAILDVVGPHLPGIPQRFDPLLYTVLPAKAKTQHAAFGPDFRTIIIGNFWQPALLGDIQKAWGKLRSALPDLSAIQWHCHPAGLQRARAAGFVEGKEIAVAPFLRGEGLDETLRTADLTLVPFSRGSGPLSDYERYSMPSRLTELCAAGLPILCLTGAGTPLHDYVTETRIAQCTPSNDPDQLSAELLSLIRDSGARARLGAAARRHAEQHFRLAAFQTWLAEKLQTLAFS